MYSKGLTDGGLILKHELKNVEYEKPDMRQNS